MTMNEPSITVLSSFDWSVPGTPELICESASHAGLAYHYFSKPTSIFKQVPANWTCSEDTTLRNRLLFFGSKLARSKTLSKIQESLVLHQIKRSCSARALENSTLFYTNLESIGGILPKLKTSFGKLVYLCADYSDLGEDFIMNSSLADKVLVIPKSMVEEVRKICGEKTEAFPQLASSFQPRSVLSGRVQQFLKEIPPPRIVYSGETGRRIDMELFSRAMKELKFCSFVSFHSGSFEKDENFFKLPWLEKFEIFQVLENSQVGCMPYDVKISHNLHCVPLKLFEYLQIGMPVVSTALINLDEFAPLVKIANNSEEFIAHLKTAILEDPDAPERRKRIKIGQNHSTKNQAGRIKSIVCEVTK